MKQIQVQHQVDGLNNSGKLSQQLFGCSTVPYRDGRAEKTLLPHGKNIWRRSLDTPHNGDCLSSMSDVNSTVLCELCCWTYRVDTVQYEGGDW